MNRHLIYSAGLLLVVVVLAGCASEAPPPAGSAPTIIAHREGHPLLDTVNSGISGVTWQLGSTGVAAADEAAASTAGEAAVKASAESLLLVDYASLSLPAFITSTKAISLEVNDFASGELNVEGSGTGKAGERYILLLWQGPELPQHPQRRLVHRWVRAYAVVRVDGSTPSVNMLLPTVGGHVEE